MDDGDLRHGWTFLPLSELLASMESGARPRGGVRGIEAGVASLGGEHLTSEGGFNFSSVRYVPRDFYERMRRGRIQVGDVLIVKDGATTGKVALVSRDFPFDEAVANEHLFVCRPKSILPEFLFWFLFSDDGQRRIHEHFKGSAQGGITQEFASRTLVPVPPLRLQERIAQLLSSVQTKRTLAHGHAVGARRAIERFRQAVLAAANSGRLTADWRKVNTPSEPPHVLRERIEGRGRVSLGRRYRESGLHTDDLWTVPPGWTWATPAMLSRPDRSLTYGVIKLGKPDADGVPTLRSSDVRWLHISVDRVKLINRQVADAYKRTYLEGGEVLVTVRGTLGGVAVVPDDMRGWNVSREVAVIPVVKDVHAPFVAFMVASGRCQQWLFKASRGVAYTGINIEDLKRLPLPLPSLEEQVEIATRVDRIFSIADELGARIEAASRALYRNESAVLAKAFHGNLLPS